jgi:hypothetical protein
LTESSKIFTAMPQSPTEYPSVKFSLEFFLARFAVCNTVGVWFFYFPTELATECEITDDHYSDGRIPSVKILPTVCVPHTDEMNPSVKLFNGVVIEMTIYWISLD